MYFKYFGGEMPIYLLYWLIKMDEKKKKNVLISLISYIGSVGKAMGDKSDDKKNKNEEVSPEVLEELKLKSADSIAAKLGIEVDKTPKIDVAKIKTEKVLTHEKQKIIEDDDDRVND